MFKALFNIIINLLATVIQIIVLPINIAIELSMPDLGDRILEVTNTFSSVFDNIIWGLGLLPAPVVSALLFILGVEIAKHSIYLTTHTLIRVWEVIRRIKFW